MLYVIPIAGGLYVVGWIVNGIVCRIGAFKSKSKEEAQLVADDINDRWPNSW